MDRHDLVFEIDGTLDVNGQYVGDWFDSAHIYNVRAIISTPDVAGRIDETSDSSSSIVYVGTTLFSPVAGNAAHGTAALTARFFRLVVEGDPDTAFHATIRAVPFS